MTRSKVGNKAKFKLFKPKQKRKCEDEIIQELGAACDSIDFDKVESFDDLPLSEKTKKALRKHEFIKPTEIQKASIKFSLRGEDVLGAAKTGSGKTLAFLIPLLETLYRKKWTKYDHVGALVITPTRELAYQIFETLKKIGEFHDFSAGLIIGGKDLKFERKRMDQCNIVICTPGRLLQHMDENPLFDCNSLLMLVLDEADRCLDMGFEKTMNSIIENLPPERQTLLFSATQTRSVKDLARLSLTDPRYISVHEHAEHSTPSGLVQSYIQCDLQDKFTFLWSFIKNHRSHKILVFLSSCKQVKFVYDIFSKMKAGVNLLALYGSLHQMKRMAVYNSFCQKQHVVLFATDIAARGLDFPSVNWVVQLDCPESANEYIHRAGRTARYERKGESLLVLLPSETKMLQHLEQKKIPIQEIQVNVKKLQNIQRNMEALLARNTALKETAQRAFVAYMKSVFLMADKEVFDISKLDTDAFARSLGLVITPRLRFLQKRQKQSESKSEKNKEPDNDPPTDEDNKEDGDDDNDDDDDDFLFVKRKNHELDADIPVPASTVDDASTSQKRKKPVSKAAVVKKMLKKKIALNKKTVFDDDGNVVVNAGKEYVSELARQYEKEDEAGIDIEKAQMVLREEDKYDKELFRQKVKRKHREEKFKLKRKKEEDEEGSDSSASSGGDDESDDDGPDLSWLPDLDKLKRRNSDESSEDEDENEDDDDDEQEELSESEESTIEETEKQPQRSMEWKTSAKRKSNVTDVPVKKKKRRNICVSSDDELGDPDMLAADEDLALQIMNMRNSHS